MKNLRTASLESNLLSLIKTCTKETLEFNGLRSKSEM